MSQSFSQTKPYRSEPELGVVDFSGATWACGSQAHYAGFAVAPFAAQLVGRWEKKLRKGESEACTWSKSTQDPLLTPRQLCSKRCWWSSSEGLAYYVGGGGGASPGWFFLR